MALNPNAEVMGNVFGNAIEIGIANLPRQNEQHLAALRIAATARGSNRNHNDIRTGQNIPIQANLVSSLPTPASEGHMEVVAVASVASDAEDDRTKILVISLGNALLNQHK